MICRIVFRNITRNRKNSSTILVLLVVIITLFLIGNTVLMEMDRGLHTTYAENYTGDVVIKADSDIPFGIFGADNPSIDDYFPIPVIKDYEKIVKILGETPSVASFVPQVSGIALMDIYGRRYKVPGGPVLLTMFGNTGFKIREVPLKGIYSYRNTNTVMDKIVLVDAQTLRALNSITLASYKDSPNQEETLSPDSIDSLFNGSDGSSEDNLIRCLKGRGST